MQVELSNSVYNPMDGPKMRGMKSIAECVVAATLAASASNLLAQNNSGSSSVQSSGGVVIGGNPANGGNVIMLGSGTNGIDIGTISKAIQDGMQQVLGSQGTNLSFGGSSSSGGLFGGNGGFDPGKMMQHFQQRMIDGLREQMGFTDDAEWEAVRPLVQKVLDLQQERQMAGGMMRARGMGFGGGAGFGKGFGNLFQMQVSPEQEALEKALDEDAPAAQVRELIGKYRTWQKAQQSKLETAQGDLRKVLTAKQEAKAMLLGLLN
jgi:hypothetical protein